MDELTTLLELSKLREPGMCAKIVPLARSRSPHLRDTFYCLACAKTCLLPTLGFASFEGFAVRLVREMPKLGRVIEGVHKAPCTRCEERDLIRPRWFTYHG